MRNFIKPLFSVLIVFALMSFQGGDILCNAKELKEKAKNSLEPYKYDSSELTRIMYKKKESVKEVEVPLFIGEKYRIVFELEALPKQIEVQIYNKDKDSKNRKLLFSSKELGADKKEFQFEVSKTRHVYVDYVVPPTEEGSYSGCAVFMVGYK
jgi:predicted nuclease with TOPRIM domain